MYRDHRLTYLWPRDLGWKRWAYSKQMYYLGGRVTLLGITIEWMDYHYA